MLDPRVRAKLWRSALVAGYLAVVAYFGVVVARFYEPGAGFSYLIAFGAKQGLPQLPEIRNLNILLQADGYGYDAQYYAQLAMRPALNGADLQRAVDSLPYRARRMLGPWLAYAGGLGRPAWILQVFAVENVLAWVVLAAVLLRWFPPTSASNLLRWGGVLLAAGMCQSLRQALVDGPSLLLLCLGVWAVEVNRRGLATVIFAACGLARETTLIGAASLARTDQRTWRHFAELAGRALLIALPLALWLVYVHRVVGPSLDTGARNFNAPLLSYLTHWRHTFAFLRQPTAIFPWPQIDLFVMIALTVQFLFFVLRPRRQEPWWRIGICFAVLMMLLGTAVWEGYPGAAPRVLLPMQVAFNVLVPRTRRWVAVLILGNLSVFGASEILVPPPGLGYHLYGPTELVAGANGERTARVEFDEHWYSAERRRSRYWIWANGEASFTVTNPNSTPVVASIRLFVDGLDQREARLTAGDRQIWRGKIGAGDARVELPEHVLPPGRTTFTIATDRPPKLIGPEARPLAFSLRNLEIRFLRRAP